MVVQFSNAAGGYSPIVIRKSFERVGLRIETDFLTQHLFVTPGGRSQHGSGIGGMQDRIDKCLSFPRAQNEHRSRFNGPLRSRFGAVQNEVSHRATLQIRRLLDEEPFAPH
jgi:hypothetical protein